METVVITGSARGFGFEMLKEFRRNDFNVVICDISEEALTEATKKMEEAPGNGLVISYLVDITKEEDLNNMIKEILAKVKTIDIWINNAGANQPNKYLWELDKSTIDRLIDIDLKGTILGSKAILPIMKKQNSGQIYNVEGHGSNDAIISGLSLYGTSKRAVTYFTDALAKEVAELKQNITIGKIAPGIMITNFISTALGDGEKIELDKKTKKVYNILGDYPETIAKFMVEKILKNKKRKIKFTWLTNRRAFVRFLTFPWNKRDFFSK